MEVFAYTVEDNHLIVDRITDSSQNGTDKGLVNLHGERKNVPEHGVNTQYQNRVECQCCNGTYTVSDVAEAEENVKTDTQHGKDNGPYGCYFKVIRNARTYFLRTDDTAARVIVAVDEGLQRDILREQRLQYSS